MNHVLAAFAAHVQELDDRGLGEALESMCHSIDGLVRRNLVHIQSQQGDRPSVTIAAADGNTPIAQISVSGGVELWGETDGVDTQRGL